MCVQELCCANTVVRCLPDSQMQRSTPYMLAYAGGPIALTDDADSVLANALWKLCDMSMAQSCDDCDTSKCSLFSTSPGQKQCFGRTFTDSPDGSGWSAPPPPPPPSPPRRPPSEFVCRKEAFYELPFPHSARFRTIVMTWAMCATLDTNLLEVRPPLPPVCSVQVHPACDLGIIRGPAKHPRAVTLATRLQELCCANTRVECRWAPQMAQPGPYLLAYDDRPIGLTASGDRVLSDALSRVCAMEMATACDDCDTSKCSLFTTTPGRKQCYGQTFTDGADSSGWIPTPAPATSDPTPAPTPAPTTANPTPAPTTYCPAGYTDAPQRFNWGLGKIVIAENHQACADRCTRFSGAQWDGGCKGYQTGTYFGMLLCKSYGGQLQVENCAPWAVPEAGGSCCVRIGA